MDHYIPLQVVKRGWQMKFVKRYRGSTTHPGINTTGSSTILRPVATATEFIASTKATLAATAPTLGCRGTTKTTAGSAKLTRWGARRWRTGGWR